MNDLGWTMGLGGLSIGILTNVLDIPGWKMSRRAIRKAKDQDFEESIKRVLVALIGDRQIDAPPSPDNPSIVDVLKDMREMMSEQKDLQTVIAWHLSDKHGPKIPDWLLGNNHHT